MKINGQTDGGGLTPQQEELINSIPNKADKAWVEELVGSLTDITNEILG